MLHRPTFLNKLFLMFGMEPLPVFISGLVSKCCKESYHLWNISSLGQYCMYSVKLVDDCEAVLCSVSHWTVVHDS